MFHPLCLILGQRISCVHRRVQLQASQLWSESPSGARANVQARMSYENTVIRKDPYSQSTSRVVASTARVPRPWHPCRGVSYRSSCACLCVCVCVYIAYMRTSLLFPDRHIRSLQIHAFVCSKLELATLQWKFCCRPHRRRQSCR